MAKRTEAERAENIARARTCWERRKDARPLQIWDSQMREWVRV